MRTGRRITTVATLSLLLVLAVSLPAQAAPDRWVSVDFSSPSACSFTAAAVWNDQGTWVVTLQLMGRDPATGATVASTEVSYDLAKRTPDGTASSTWSLPTGAGSSLWWQGQVLLRRKNGAVVSGAPSTQVFLASCSLS